MKSLYGTILFFCCVMLPADNLSLRMDFYESPEKIEDQHHVESVLKAPSTEKLVSGKVLCSLNAESSVSLIENFEFREMGFTVKFTPESLPQKDFYRTDMKLFWQFSPEGPFKTSGKESFREGTNLSSRWPMLVGNPIPFGVSYVDETHSFLPLFQLDRQKHTGLWEFNTRSEWEITLEIQKEGEKTFSETCRPVYSKHKFPPKPVPGLECRMWNSSGITAMNLRFCREIGTRENGNLILESLDLSLCFEAPSPQHKLLLAELTSFCSAENCALEKRPNSGGKPETFRILLQTK